VGSGLYTGVSEEAKLEEKVARKPVDQLIVRFPCKAFIMAKVAEFRTLLLKRLKYVPPGTYVRFTWEFEKNAMGKPLDKVGLVEIFFKWGGEVPKKE